MNAETPRSYFDTSPAAQSVRGKRAKGSRSKLAQKFFEGLYAAWEEQGDSVIARAMFHDPVSVLNVVARLMPQKIEVSTPTDGMSDERLAELLDLAERMAAVSAAQHGDATALRVIEHSATVVAPLLPDSLNASSHENGVSAVSPAGRGEGADAVEVLAGGNTPPTLRPSIQNDRSGPHNPLCNSAVAIDGKDATMPHNPLDIASLPYPVGRPFPEADASVERRNIARLTDEDIDPASLF